ncbi:hypothetical protein GCM10009830_19410 [Glycomyces endophyticus]|uniref:Uncharacterized protein n=1 Tax=Glycomyces endophyticus TaxID=480996 RepID=A0ABN2GLL4_9ACTN
MRCIGVVLSGGRVVAARGVDVGGPGLPEGTADARTGASGGDGPERDVAVVRARSIDGDHAIR